MGSFDAGLFVWTLITFGLLLAVLARYVYRPLGKILGDREAAIRQSLDEAKSAREEALHIRAQNEESLRHVREEAGKVIKEGHRIVSTMKREAAENAKEEATLIVRQARTDIDREVQRSLDELKGTVANLSIRISRQVIREHLDENRYHELADDFIERLKKTHASGNPASR